MEEMVFGESLTQILLAGVSRCSVKKVDDVTCALLGPATCATYAASVLLMGRDLSVTPFLLDGCYESHLSCYVKER